MQAFVASRFSKNIFLNFYCCYFFICQKYLVYAPFCTKIYSCTYAKNIILNQIRNFDMKIFLPTFNCNFKWVIQFQSKKLTKAAKLTMKRRNLQQSQQHLSILAGFLWVLFDSWSKTLSSLYSLTIYHIPHRR